MTKTMSFEDFEKNKYRVENDKLFSLIGGIRGAGKSTCIGSLNLRTFLITFSLESHAVYAAQLLNKTKLLPVLCDIDDKGNQLNPDATIINLHKILDFLIEAPDLTEKYDVIAFDSLGAFDKIVFETTKILADKVVWNHFRVAEDEHLKVIRKLKTLNRKGVHIIVTMPLLAEYDSESTIISTKPELRGITNTSVLVGIFDEAFVLSRLEKNFIFQMDIPMIKKGKTVDGEKKTVIYHPRLSWLLETEIREKSPDMLFEANLSHIHKLKISKINQK